ncbi:MAG: helix-turn-helix domain-containing protein [Ignavibacteria bacterium]|nr:helix-turn-helix domain-containing protein [Ignavibacteria bacterium]
MKKIEIQKRLDKALMFRNQEEADLFEAEKLQLDILAQLREYMQVNRISKANIAKLLNTSKSYITQLFSGDKLLNLKTLAKLQKRLNIKFNFTLIDKKNKRNYNEQDKEIDKYNKENYSNILKIVPDDELVDIETKSLYPKNRIKDMDYNLSLAYHQIKFTGNSQKQFRDAS